MTERYNWVGKLDYMIEKYTTTLLSPRLAAARKTNPLFKGKCHRRHKQNYDKFFMQGPVPTGKTNPFFKGKCHRRHKQNSNKIQESVTMMKTMSRLILEKRTSYWTMREKSRQRKSYRERKADLEPQCPTW